MHGRTGSSIPVCVPAQARAAAVQTAYPLGADDDDNKSCTTIDDIDGDGRSGISPCVSVPLVLMYLMMYVILFVPPAANGEAGVG